MHKLICRIVLLVLAALAPVVLRAGQAEHVVLIIWDGMRPDFITKEHTPALDQLVRDGVMFQNHHAVYCSSTEVNGTTLATGAYPAHGGIIANRLYLPEVNPLSPVDTQGSETIRRVDELTGGHYLGRPTLAETLQAVGNRTVIAGTKPVALLQDRRQRPAVPGGSVILFAGKTLPISALMPIQESMGPFPADASRSSSEPNEPRDEWTTSALLGPLWIHGVPAFSLLWLSEPDFSQHAAGPGSRKALAALASSDRKLARVLAELEKWGLRAKTDVFVVSDHGFSTVQESVDVCERLRRAGFPASRKFKSTPRAGDILVVGQGGSVLFYVVNHDRETVGRLIDFLQGQDFSGVLFTREAMAGTFTLAQACIDSSNAPDAVVSMRWSAERSRRRTPGLQISDGDGQPVKGNHGSLSRFDLHNTLVGAGPDLKTGFTDTLPAGNTDLAPTILWLLGVKPQEPMDGRVLSEALTVDAPPVGRPVTRRLEATRRGKHLVWRQYLQISQVNGTVYLDEGNGEVTRK